MTELDLDVFKEMAERHLEETSDLTIVVLKGHLLLEAALNTALEQQCANASSFEKANLRFIQMVHLARALFPETEIPERVEDEKKIWDAMVAFNQLRNRFAHTLEPQGFADLFPRLFLVPSNEPGPFDDKEIVHRLGNTISALVGWTLGMGARHARKTA